MPFELTFEGGLNETNRHYIQAGECFSGFNFTLNHTDGSFRRRPTQDSISVADNGEAITGLVQLRKRNDTLSTLVQAGTSLYRYAPTSMTTVVATVASGAKLRGIGSQYNWELGDYQIITDIALSEPVSTWNGTTYSAMGHTIPGVTNFYAKYAAVKDGRVWLFNIRTDGDYNPHMLLASEYEDASNYDSSTLGESVGASTDPFYMLSPDMRTINGACLFKNQLIISTNNGRLFRLSGTDPSTYAWVDFYDGSAAIGTETLLNIGNDVMYLQSGANVELLSSTEEYGDVKADDVGRFIQTTLSNVTDAISVYDQWRQRAYFFIANKVLVFDKNSWGVRRGLSPWAVWTTNMPNLFNAGVAGYIAHPDYPGSTVVWGDDQGNLYDLNGQGLVGDDDEYPIVANRVSREAESPEFISSSLAGRVHYSRRGECVANITGLFGGSFAKPSVPVTLKGPTFDSAAIFFGGPAWLGGPYYFGAEASNEEEAAATSTVGFDLPGEGGHISLTIEIQTSGEFEVNKIKAGRPV